MRSNRPAVRAAAVLALAAAVTACSSSGDSKAATATTTAAGKPVKVLAVDYAYKNLPSSVKAGTQFELTNESAKELHEFVALPLPAAEKRAVADIVKLPEAELGPILGGQPATVLIAPPGGAPVIKAVGDGTITTPGRYIVLCAIPTGAKPQDYLDALAKNPGKKPEGVAGGPPHFVGGMVAELNVT